MKDAMERSVKPREFELPLELQFSMRKAELEAQEMTWDQLYAALLNLYQRRLIEWAAVKDILQGENIELCRFAVGHFFTYPRRNIAA